jgi:hypothetical protein
MPGGGSGSAALGGLQRPQRGAEGRVVGKSLRGALGEQLEDQLARRRGQRSGVDRLVDVLAGDLSRRAPLKGKSPRQQSIGDDTHRVEVGPRVDLLVSDQLGGEVLRFAGDGRERPPGSPLAAS